ncbi:Non-canonical poly(A) RNA polymerase protein Trf4-1 [Pseudolycoriella hygida]|uniref:Non-canonical poly(A) RNA polymerase protein Trf4-1 n=1 Tax=Pseudolycoriella hygida TaxID=35572 RepID=A0A9Q0N647_9DIPT|nr:Non-canonical poly(A) RNA polymerase protein Trf4-1 [Pseudolycoriella hygida]KAJ6644272.1 Non-canonical poly(A) RNA polymerase protein Trf4-1 [Pseudolycoriella hygida]
MRLSVFVIGIIIFKCIAADDEPTDTDQQTCAQNHSQPEYSWRPTGFVYQPGVMELHTEIEQFYEYVQQTPVERALRQRVIDRIELLVHQVWPSAEVKIIGSNVLGLALPNSDIDAMIVNASGPSPIHSLADVIVKSDIAVPDSIIVRDNLRVPIIEFTDRESKIEIDLPLHDAATLKKAAHIKEFQRKYPVLSKLVLVLKQYLKLRKLNNVFTGGISAHPLTLMTISFLQMHPTYKAGEDANLGELLLDFLELYGKKFDFENFGLTVKDGGKYLPRNELPCGIFNDHYQLFCVEDPLVPVNACDDAYRAAEVKQAFSDAYNVLSAATSVTRMSTNQCTGDSILGRIIQVTDLIEYRKWIEQNLQHILQEL